MWKSEDMKHAILPYYNAISLYRTTHPMLIEKRQKPTTATVIKHINQDNNLKKRYHRGEKYSSFQYFRRDALFSWRQKGHY